MTKITEEHALVSYINKQRRTNHKDYQNCLFASFLSQKEPKKVIQALDDLSWIEAMQEELLQFKLQKVWTLVDLPNDKRAIGTNWVFRYKKDEREIVVRNKPRLVAQGYTQEEGIDYYEVFALVARIEAIRIANRIRVQYRFQFANSCRCFDLFLLLLPRFDMLFLTSGITVSECNEKTNVLFVDTLKVKVLFSFKVGEKDSKSIKKKVTKPLKVGDSCDESLK
ncbi:putative ribonuclease H-like domain-containing protein [Tanacetum coccineum]